MASALFSSLFFTTVVAASCVAAAASSWAGESPKTAREKADQLCASYGPGFVAGNGPGHCVKVEERLRVDPNGRRGMSGFDNPTAFAPIEDGPMRAHVRVNGGFGALSAPPGR